jgi:DNA recombination protein RmuC
MNDIANDVRLLVLLGVCLAVGLCVGALGWGLWIRRRRLGLEVEIATLRGELKSQQAIAEERARTMEHAEARLSASFAELASKKFNDHSESFLRLAKENLGAQQERANLDLTKKEQSIAQLVKPIQEALKKTHQQIGEIEKSRHESFGSIAAQLKVMAESQETLQGETRNLVTALRRPEVRGQWGELTLRRVAELAGMVNHCDFIEQAHTETESGAVRPDMIVRLPDQGTIVIDAKTPLDAYLTAIEANDDQSRKVALRRHERKVAERVRELASKAYWAQFEESPEFVILFIPGDQFLAAAMDVNPELHDEALRQKIILATPTSLIALLKTVAYGWRQVQLAENAEEIKRLAQDMHDRLSTFTGHLAKLGKQLEGSVKAFNSAVGSMERKVLPGARKFVELGVQAKEELPTLSEIETTARDIEDRSATQADDRPQPDDRPQIESIDVNSDPKDNPPAH